MNKVIYFLSILLFFGVVQQALAQDEPETETEQEEPVSEDQKLFFVPSFGNLTGFAAGLEYDFRVNDPTKRKKYMIGLVLGAGAPNLIRPLYEGNKINVRLFGALSFSRAQLLLGWYIGSFGFDAPVDAAYLQSPTISVRFSPDRKRLWLIELGSSPLIPDRYENNGLSISPANAPPFLFVTIYKRLKERKPANEGPFDEPENSESYPPVFIK